VEQVEATGAVQVALPAVHARQAVPAALGTNPD